MHFYLKSFGPKLSVIDFQAYRKLRFATEAAGLFEAFKHVHLSEAIQRLVYISPKEAI